MIQSFPDSLPAGTNLLQYRVEKVLGQGGFGLTYLAQDTRLDMSVALKEFFPRESAAREPNGGVRPKSSLENEQFAAGLKGFLSEAQILARFRHPNIVQVHNFFEENSTAYMVMAFEKGESLSVLLKLQEHWSEVELLKIVLPLLDGLKILHGAGFIHRDIKPGNIYIRQNGTPVLLDFGATRHAIGEHTKTLTALLTPGYAPMEQYYSSSKRQGAWTDIYAMGAVLYRAITGQVPDHATDRMSALPRGELDPLPPLMSLGLSGYSHHFLEAIDHALQVLEKDRPQTVTLFRSELVNSKTGTSGDYDLTRVEVLRGNINTKKNVRESVAQRQSKDRFFFLPAFRRWFDTKRRPAVSGVVSTIKRHPKTHLFLLLNVFLASFLSMTAMENMFSGRFAVYFLIVNIFPAILYVALIANSIISVITNKIFKRKSPNNNSPQYYWRTVLLLELFSYGWAFLLVPGCINGNCTNGVGEYVNLQGKRYIGQWQEGERNGQGMTYYSSGEKHTGLYLGGNRTGPGVYYYPDGTVKQGNWKKGKLHGDVMVTTPDGRQTVEKW